MLKSLVLYGMIFTLSLQSISHFILLEEFTLNRDYIISTKCENKDKPQKHCNGKCYLKKEMEKQQDSPANTTVKTKKDMLLFLETIKEVLPIIYFNKIHYAFLITVRGVISIDILQPPRIS